MEVYYDLLWYAAYQYDLNKSPGEQQRKVFISHQVDNFDESDYESGKDILNESEEVYPSSYSVFHSSFDCTEPKKPTKNFIPCQLWGDSQRQPRR